MLGEFDFKQFLVETQTVSQYLKTTRQVPAEVVKGAKKSVKMVLDRLPMFQGVTAKNLPRYINYFTYWAIKEYITTYADPKNPLSPSGIRASHLSQSQISSFDPSTIEFWKDINGWAMATARRKIDEWGDFIVAHFEDNTVQSKFNRIDYTPAMVENDVEEWHKELANIERLPGGEGRTIIALDRLGREWKGWKWLSLDRQYCDEEREAGGHCGNAAYVEGDNILSLRGPNNWVHLTFIVNDKILGEMKGYENQKPSPKYFPAIVELLKSPYVNALRGGGYKPENNFSFQDLDPTTQEQLKKQKPYIDNWSGYFVAKLKESLSKTKNKEEVLNLVKGLFPSTSFDSVEIQNKKTIIVLEEWGDLSSAYEELKNGRGSIEDFSNIDSDDRHGWDYSTGLSDGDIAEMVVDNADKESIDKFNEYFKRIQEDEDFQFDEDDTLADKIAQDDDLSNEMRWAYDDAARSGQESEEWKNLINSLGDRDSHGFFCEVDWERIKLKISLEDFIKLYEKLLKYETEEELEDVELMALQDLDFSHPYNGYDGFDDGYFKERIKEKIYEHFADVFGKE